MPSDPMDAPRWARHVRPKLPTGPHPFLLEPGPPPVRRRPSPERPPPDASDVGETLLPDLEAPDGVDPETWARIAADNR